MFLTVNLKWTSSLVLYDVLSKASDTSTFDRSAFGFAAASFELSVDGAVELLGGATADGAVEVGVGSGSAAAGPANALASASAAASAAKEREIDLAPDDLFTQCHPC